MSEQKLLNPGPPITRTVWITLRRSDYALNQLPYVEFGVPWNVSLWLARQIDERDDDA